MIGLIQQFKFEPAFWPCLPRPNGGHIISGLIDSTRRFAHSRYALPALFTSALLLRITLFFAAGPVIWPDSIWYYREAQQILFNGTFNSIAIFHTPLYPMFLAGVMAVFDKSVAADVIISIQHLFAIASVWLVYRIAKNASGPTTALFCGIAAAVSPLLLYYENVIQTEVLFVPLLLWLIDRTIETGKSPDGWKAACVGILAGLLTMTRPVALFLPILIVCFLWPPFRRNGRSGALCARLILAYFAVLSPWIIHNHLANGFWGVAKGQGLNLYLRAIDLDRLQPEDPNSELTRLYNRISRRHGRSYSMVADRLTAHHPLSAHADDLMFDFAFSAVRAHPLRFIFFAAIDSISFFVSPNPSITFCPSTGGMQTFCCRRRHGCNKPLGVLPGRQDHSPLAMLIVFSLFNLVGPLYAILIAMGLPMGLLWVHMETDLMRQRIAMLFIATSLYFAALAVSLNKPEDRYRLPADPLLIICFAAAGAEIARRNIPASRRPLAGPPVLTMIDGAEQQDSAAESVKQDELIARLN